MVFGGVGHHDGALGGPEETGANTQEGAGEDVEAGDILMLRNQETNGVNGVADSTEGEGQTDAETIDDGAGEETHDREGTVESDVL